jgi:hypothetical protein
MGLWIRILYILGGLFMKNLASTQQPQQEYIITDKQLKTLVESSTHMLNDDINDNIQSHPHTPTQYQDYQCWTRCSKVREAQQAAKAARDQVLGEIQTIINNSRIFAEKQCIERVAENARDYYNIRASTLEYVLDKIKSLRTPTKEQP